MAIRVLVWNEWRHEKTGPQVSRIYPEGIHGAIAGRLEQRADLQVATATLDSDAEHGCGQDVLKQIDVLVWWGHRAHHEVRDDVVDRIQQRVLQGMGLIVLHSGHFSKIFKRLMGTSCDLKWRDIGEREILWVTRPGHPIVQGLGEYFILDHEEMYGEFFDVPEPMETVLISSFTGSEVFRSGITFERGLGRIFYFRPGHETQPSYRNPNVLRVIENAVRWAATAPNLNAPGFGNRPPGWINP